MIDPITIERIVAGVASVAGTFAAADKGLPRLAASAKAAAQGRGLKELLHLHETVPQTVRRLGGDALDPVGRHGLHPFRLILGVDPVTGRIVQGKRGRGAVFFGPPGSGKTCMMAANVQAWVLAGGVAICGSEAPDVLRAVRKPCLHRGDVYCFDPLGALTDNPEPGVIMVGWSPVPGADDPGVALDRMMALTVDAGKGVENGGHFRNAAALLGACLLYAAALEGLPWSIMYGWVCDYMSHPKIGHVGGAEKAAAIIRRHRGDEDHLLKSLVGYMPWLSGNADTRNVENILGQLRPCLRWSVKPELRAFVDAASTHPFDMHKFLNTPHASLHIICPAGEGSADAGPLVIGFIAALRKASRELGRAMGEENGANPIPVLAPLDEVANYPMPELPSILAVERKYNWTVIAVFQTLAQAARGWGNEFAQELLTIGGAKVLLPGCSEPALTQWASGLSGPKMVDRQTSNDGWSRRMQVDVDAKADEEGRGKGAAKVRGSLIRRWQRSSKGTQTVQHEVPRYTQQDICDLDEGTAWVKDGSERARIIGLPLHYKVQPFKRWSEIGEPALSRNPWMTHIAPVRVLTPEADDGRIVPIAALRDQRDHRDDAAAQEGA